MSMYPRSVLTHRQSAFNEEFKVNVLLADQENLNIFIMASQTSKIICFLMNHQYFKSGVKRYSYRYWIDNNPHWSEDRTYTMARKGQVSIGIIFDRFIISIFLSKNLLERVAKKLKIGIGLIFLVDMYNSIYS